MQRRLHKNLVEGKKTESSAHGHSVAPYVKMVKQGLAQLVIARPSVREVSPEIYSNFYLKSLFLLFSPFFVALSSFK